MAYFERLALRGLPTPLDTMPACDDPLVAWILDAFMTLSGSRQNGLGGVQRIAISEIAAFVSLVDCPISGEWLLKAIQTIDREYCSWLTKTMK